MSGSSTSDNKRYGLIGRSLSHSWSKSYFNERFKKESIAASYVNIECDDIAELDQELLLSFSGLNVTVPYKEQIIPFLDSLDPTASAIGAVNCIKVDNGQLIGYNTDAFGFRDSLRPFLKSWHSKALILGTGGASKAIAYVLEEMGIEIRFVSRNPRRGQFSYDELNAKAVEIFPFIINCTPLGMYPDIESFPAIPYEHLTDKNLLYDVVYNPEESLFLKKGTTQGAQTINGLHMLIAQAEASWRIWNGGSVEPAIDHHSQGN